MRNKVAVIAGTKVDTQMGVDYLKSKDPSLEPFYYNISPSPEAQRVFQYGDEETKERIITNVFEDAEQKGIQDFFIYCNSLSAAFDFESFGKSRGVQVVTPIMVYRKLASEYQHIAVIAANCLSTRNIEKQMWDVHPGIDVTGFSVGAFVRAIERSMTAEEMVEFFHFRGLIDFIESNGVEGIILGCTHFPHFKAEMEKLTDLPVIDPAEGMYEMLIEGMKS